MNQSPTASAQAPRNELELEERLSRPDDRVFGALRSCAGDVIVLGAGGKMGPSLCRMLQRAVDELGDKRRIIAVSRFAGSDHPSLAYPGVAGSERIATLSRDLTSPEAVAAIPLAPNVIYMAGQKFGTSDDPASTWAMNASVPTLVANRFRSSRIVVFSSGNVYPLVQHATGGSRESDHPAPAGEYAASCLARERLFTYYTRRYGSSALILRLNYAVDLRYGVIVDIALKVLRGEPVDLSMGYANVIWQGDANAIAIASLEHCANPPCILNVTGVATLAVRDVALRVGELLGRTPVFAGSESPDALLSDSSQMRGLFGDPLVSEATLVEWVAAWLKGGGCLLGKPTHFGERGGRY